MAKVAKFGGSSLADAKQVQRVCDLIAADPERRWVVVSAPGKRQDVPDDIKITDQLVTCAEHHLASLEARHLLDDVIGRYEQICRSLSLGTEVIAEIQKDFWSRLQVGNLSRMRFIDRMKAAGEDNCARMVAAALRARGVDAHYVSPRDAGLVVTDEASNARVLEESYRNLSVLKKAPGVTVFPGFFGATRQGEIVTFPRGGSDITGAILARAVEADVYENFTDVDMVRVVDPELIPNPAGIRELTYREMRELSYTGFSVFNDEALAPVAEVGIPVWIRNTNNTDSPGTRIVASRRYTPGEIVGITSRDGFCALFVSKYLMNREVGFGRQLLSILERENLAYEHAPTGIDNISVILRESSFQPAVRQRVIERIKERLAPDDVSFESGLALVMVVGEGMKHTPGLAARATGALGRARINIEMLNQGSSEISITFGIRAEKRKQAVRALYREFFKGPQGWSS